MARANHTVTGLTGLRSFSHREVKFEHPKVGVQMSGMQLWLVSGFLLTAACSRPEGEPPRQNSQRARDSVLGASKLPGAQGIRGALGAADSAAARNARLDSLAQ